MLARLLGTKIFIPGLLAITGTLAYAQQPDYFPLVQSNIWIYRCTGACGAAFTVTVQVGPPQDFNGTTYSQLQGWFGKDYWVREDSNGMLWALDSSSNQERLWYAFQTPEGGSYTESIPSACCGKATIPSRSAHYEGPVGIFDNALQIDYPGVFQLGIERERFLPYAGLVSRNEAAGGPSARTFDLIYARVYGVTVVSQPEISVSLSLDRAVYPGPSAWFDTSTLSARFSIRNVTSDPLALTFPTGQIYDLEIRDDRGNVVFLWSKDRVFPQIVTTVQLQDEKDYIITAPTNNLAPGKYVAQAWLTVAGPARAYSASVAFQVK